MVEVKEGGDRARASECAAKKLYLRRSLQPRQLRKNYARAVDRSLIKLTVLLATEERSEARTMYARNSRGASCDFRALFKFSGAEYFVPLIRASASSMPTFTFA